MLTITHYRATDKYSYMQCFSEPLHTMLDMNNKRHLLITACQWHNKRAFTTVNAMQDDIENASACIDIAVPHSHPW